VQRLERQLGTRLLHRTTRKVQMTQDGQAFYERCKDLLADMEELQTMFRIGHAGLAGIRKPPSVAQARAGVHALDGRSDATASGPIANQPWAVRYRPDSATTSRSGMAASETSNWHFAVQRAQVLQKQSDGQSHARLHRSAKQAPVTHAG